MANNVHNLKLINLEIDTFNEAAIFLHTDCVICKSEGFAVQKRIQVTIGNKSILATLYTLKSTLLQENEAALSTAALELLDAKFGDLINLSHPIPLQSMHYVREKIYGKTLDAEKLESIIQDVSKNNYSDIEIAAFLTAFAGETVVPNEILNLTRAMIKSGEVLKWDKSVIADKHCVGGLPGNRTTLIVVPIIAALGITIPKTSSRAITSPAGTSDTMEVLAPVNLNIQQLRKVVEKENGCIVWGGSVSLSPADDILIRVERVLYLDSVGQVVASILSKKIAAGATHVIIDIPTSTTTKIATLSAAQNLSKLLHEIAAHFNVKVKTLITDGSHPIGRGIGPALEAQDVIDVLRCNSSAPIDLRIKSLQIAGELLEFTGFVPAGLGIATATKVLDSGQAWKKFQAICDAQGGMRDIKTAPFKHIVTATKNGEVTEIDNRAISKLATLAGAPSDKLAGVYIDAPVGTEVSTDEPLFTIHSESKGELQYALSLLKDYPDIIKVAKVYE